MSTNRTLGYLIGLVEELRSLPHETEWVEFKQNQNDPQYIGKCISALANGATLNGKSSAYLVWGIEDKTHAILGTSLSLAGEMKGNEPLENWLRRGLVPHTDFHIYEFAVDERRIILHEISHASHYPVAFDGQEFIRVGSVIKRLKDPP